MTSLPVGSGLNGLTLPAATNEKAERAALTVVPCASGSLQGECDSFLSQKKPTHSEGFLRNIHNSAGITISGACWAVVDREGKPRIPLGFGVWDQTGLRPRRGMTVT